MAGRSTGRQVSAFLKWGAAAVLGVGVAGSPMTGMPSHEELLPLLPPALAGLLRPRPPDPETERACRKAVRLLVTAETSLDLQRAGMLVDRLGCKLAQHLADEDWGSRAPQGR